MKKVKKSLLNELYELNSKSKKIKEEREFADDEVVGLTKEDLEELELIDSQIHNLLLEISAASLEKLDTSGLDTSMIVWGLLVGIGHLSISRFFKCLEVCGVEIEE